MSRINCFGRCSLERGHNLDPTPPDKMTGTIIDVYLLFGVKDKLCALSVKLRRKASLQILFCLANITLVKNIFHHQMILSF